MTIKLLQVHGQKTRHENEDKWAAFDEHGRCVASGTYRAMDCYARTVDPTYNARRFREVNAHRNGMGIHS